MAPDPRLAPGGWAEVRAAVGAPAGGGHRSHHRRGAQPHGRRRRRRPDALAARARQPRLLPADAGRSAHATSTTPAAATYWRWTVRPWCGSRWTRCGPGRFYGGVDGFRFDLATTLGRRASGFDPAAPLLTAIAQDPALRELRSSPSPGTSGRAATRSAQFPPAGANGTTDSATACASSGAAMAGMRGEAGDPLRRLVRHVRREATAVAHRSISSSPMTASRWPISSLTAHKHNDGNGEENRDGTDANYSWNNGAEGRPRTIRRSWRRGGATSAICSRR